MGIHATPRIYDFAAAKRLWARRTPWRGDSTPSARPLADRRDKHITIRSTDDPSSPVYCRLYNTDCVTFHADGTIGITGYPSKSTVEFIRGLVGHYVDPLRLCEAYRVHGGRVARGPNITLRLTGDYSPPVEVVKSEPFEFYSLDRKKVNALLKSLRWREFRTWALTAFDLLEGDTDDRARLYAAAEEAFPEIFAEPRFDHIWVRMPQQGDAWVAAIRQSILRKNIRSLRTTEQLHYCKDEKEYRRKIRAHLKAF